MAEIPVEKKSGIPWWVWLLLALLLVGLLLWWLLDDGDEAEYAAVAPVTTEAPLDPTMGATNETMMADGNAAMMAGGATAAGGAITDAGTILNASDRSALVGRQVQLSDMRVVDVVGDRSFYVAPSADAPENQRLFVVLNEMPTPGTPGTEGRYDVTEGQVVSIDGVFRATGDSAFAGSEIEGLPSGMNAVIHAQSLNITQRP